MRVLKLTLGKIFFLQFFLQFLFFSVKRPDGLFMHLDRCGTGGRTVRLHVQTHVACRMLMWQRSSEGVSELFGLGPHRLYVMDPTLAAAYSHFLLRFSCIFCLFVSFSFGLVHYLGLFCPFVHLSHLSRYFINYCYSFQ
jgi:hypothetical protein